MHLSHRGTSSRVDSQNGTESRRPRRLFLLYRHTRPKKSDVNDSLFRRAAALGESRAISVAISWRFSFRLRTIGLALPSFFGFARPLTVVIWRDLLIRSPAPDFLKHQWPAERDRVFESCGQQ